MNYIQTIVIGCIAVLAGSLVPHITESISATVFAGALLLFIIWIARKVGQHFSHGHTHDGDSSLDSSIGVTLFVVNVLHPLVDGFALYQTYINQSRYLFFSVLVGIALHELFRQSALIVVFRQFGFAGWKVVLPALAGIGFGAFLGMMGGNLSPTLEPYIDALTFGAYVFIVAEHLFAHKEVFKKRNLVFALIAGVAVATIFVAFFNSFYGLNISTINRAVLTTSRIKMKEGWIVVGYARSSVHLKRGIQLFFLSVYMRQAKADIWQLLW